MMASDRDDEAFAAYASLMFFGVGLLVAAVVVGTIWLAVDRWGGGLTSPAALDRDWPLRAGGVR